MKIIHIISDLDICGAEGLLSEQKLKNGRYFGVKQIKKVWELHSNGKNQQYQLWSVLMFQAWLGSN